MSGMPAWLEPRPTFKGIKEPARRPEASGPKPSRYANTGLKQNVSNPWGLTFSESDVMDALCEAASIGGAAAALEISWYTAQEHIKAAYKKMAVHCMVHACIKWDRWRQTDGKGVPA